MITIIFSGTIVALKGHTTENGKFNVESTCYSGLPYQTAPDLDEPMANGEDRYKQQKIFDFPINKIPILIHSIAAVRPIYVTRL